MGSNPKCIYIFSGKRKSGKDYFTDRLFNRLNSKQILLLKLSAPIKQLHAEMNKLNYEELMGSTEYKEAYRKDMLEWSQNIRNEDYGYFCRAAIKMCNAENYPFWIVSDARRKTDVKWFKENFGFAKIKVFRIVCSDETRIQRGWVFTEGVDDGETECGLDDFDDWDLIIKNDGSGEISAVIESMVEEINLILSR